MKRTVDLVLIVACALLLGSAAARADGLIVIPEPLPMPHPPPWMPPHPFAPLEVREHHVTVRIEDQVAITEVNQTFYNPNDRRLEGTYIFPLPRGAEIDSFRMEVDGKMLRAELLDAEKARRIYEDIVRRMRDPALMEYAGTGMFRVRIFPIEPRSEKRVRMRYTQILKSDAGLIEYRYPLNTEKFSAAPLKSVSIKVELEVRKGIKSLFCPSHEVEIVRDGERRAVVGFEARDVRPDTDFVLYYAVNPESDVGLDLLTYRDGDDPDGGFFLLLASPSVRNADERIVEKDVVFVLDTSGSMADDHKIDQAKRALRFCLSNLNAGDRFEVVRFATEAEPLFGRLVSTTRENLSRAESFVDGLRPIGGTAIEEALIRALEPAREQAREGRPYVIIFLTDGRPTIGNTDEDAIVSGVIEAMGDRPVRIFSFGIGTDINTHLLDRLTERTRAASQYVLPGEDIELKVSRFYEKINEPVLAGLRLRIEGGIRVSRLTPHALPDLFKGEQLVVLGRYIGEGDAAIRLAGTVNGERREYVYEGTFPAEDTRLEFIPRLWATRRVGYLLEQIRLHGESEELRREVTELARRYGIVTPYTAYLIVEDEARRDVPAPQRTLQLLDRDRAARSEVRRMYEEMTKEKSGFGAVGGAQAFDSLKRARSAAAPAQANAFTLRGQLGEGKRGADRALEVMQTQQTRFIQGRTFYQNGDQWVDSLIQKRPGARVVKVKFNSDEYFELLRKHPGAVQWFALGRNVSVLIGDTIYQIIE
jgi:Ca-activated chloride channel family protein